MTIYWDKGCERRIRRPLRRREDRGVDPEIVRRRRNLRGSYSDVTAVERQGKPGRG